MQLITTLLGIEQRRPQFRDSLEQTGMHKVYALTKYTKSFPATNLSQRKQCVLRTNEQNGRLVARLKRIGPTVAQ